MCASDKTPTRATITYGVGIGESIAEQGTTDRWLGEGVLGATVPATTIDGPVSAPSRTSRTPSAAPCGRTVSGSKKDYAYGKCNAYARIG